MYNQNMPIKQLSFTNTAHFIHLNIGELVGFKLDYYFIYFNAIIGGGGMAKTYVRPPALYASVLCILNGG